MIRRRVIVILALTLAAWILTGCDPQKGQPCSQPGEQKFHYPDHWTCVQGPHGDTWQKMGAYDLGVGTWQYVGHGHR